MTVEVDAARVEVDPGLNVVEAASVKMSVVEATPVEEIDVDAVEAASFGSVGSVGSITSDVDAVDAAFVVASVVEATPVTEIDAVPVVVEEDAPKVDVDRGLVAVEVPASVAVEVDAAKVEVDPGLEAVDVPASVVVEEDAAKVEVDNPWVLVQPFEILADSEALYFCI